jgi:hypothetical protein
VDDGAGGSASSAKIENHDPFKGKR